MPFTKRRQHRFVAPHSAQHPPHIILVQSLHASHSNASLTNAAIPLGTERPAPSQQVILGDRLFNIVHHGRAALMNDYSLVAVVPYEFRIVRGDYDGPIRTLV